jgi:two-component sensor histidine kinase
MAVFRQFAEQVSLDSNYRGALGMGWARRVDAADAATSQGMPPGVRIWPLPAQGQPIATPITFLHPATEANRRAIGYNMYSEAVRRQAMEEAARQSIPVASGKVVLVQENGSQRRPGFLIYMPVFRTAATGQQLFGYVYSPFRAQDFLDSAAELYSVRAVGISVFDGSPDPENQLATVALAGKPGDTVFKPLVIASRPWVLEVTAPKSAALSPLSRATLLFGSIVALLLLLISRLITKRAEEDRQVLDWQTRQAAIRTSLTRELNHRVKNTLANVLSIAALTKRRATDIDDYVEKLTGRVRALSATHDLLTRSEWGNTALRDVVEAELAPYHELADNHVRLAGPDIALAPNDALSLGLVIHELATNATKYGALSADKGVVHIHWRLISDALAEIHWREQGGPLVVEPDKRGFGRDLIEKIVAHELKTPVDLRFLPTGVECRLSIPVRTPIQFTLRTGATIPPA